MKPHSNQLIVDFIRHGDTLYTGEGLDLTETGQAQIKATVYKICRTLNSNHSVVIWSSPAPRALGSAAVAIEVLDAQGINSSEIEIIPDLGPVNISNLGKFMELFQEAEARQISHDQVFASHEAFATPSSDFESRPEIQTRVDRVFARLSSMAKQSATAIQSLHLLVFTHFEPLYQLIEKNWPEASSGTDNNIKKGESVRLVYTYHSSSDKFIISGVFRDHAKSKITLN